MDTDALLQPRPTVALGTPTLANTSIVISNYTGDSVTVNYTGLPGNQPQSYKNFVAIWQSSVIPWGNLPLSRQDIGDNSEQGSIVLSGLTITRSSYIVGYGVGPDVSNISCCAIISAGGLLAPPTTVGIGLDNVGITSLTVNYQTLAGYTPNTYENWIGLWKGYASPFNGTAPLAKVSITDDSNQGSIGINNVPLGINTEYTLVYFCGAAYTTAAAILTFNTNDQA